METKGRKSRKPGVARLVLTGLAAAVLAAVAWLTFGPDAPVVDAAKPPKPPVVTISSPDDGASFAPDTEVDFAGTAIDKEDGDLSASLLWTSDLDGDLHTGATFSSDSLSEGAHTIVASVTDSSGAEGTASVTITVEEPPEPPPLGPWSIETVDSDGDVGEYNALAFDPDDDTPAIVYSDHTNAAIKFARLSTATGEWDIEVLDEAAWTWRTADLAFDPADGNPSVSYLTSALKFAHWDGSSWQPELVAQVEETKTKGPKPDYEPSLGHSCSLAYAPDGNPSIVYTYGMFDRGGRVVSADLFLAHRNGGTWEHRPIDTGVIMWPSLAYDPITEMPSVAYCDKADGSYKLKFAFWNGSAWEIDVVRAATYGPGLLANLAYDPTTEYSAPAITHAGDKADESPFEFVSGTWNGSAWSWADEIVRTGSYLMPSPSLAFDAAGTAMVAFRCDNYCWFAWRNANAPGGWSVEAVEFDPDASLSWISLAVDTQGNPAITNGYGFSYDHELRFAVRTESIYLDP